MCYLFGCFQHTGTLQLLLVYDPQIVHGADAVEYVARSRLLQKDVAHLVEALKVGRFSVRLHGLLAIVHLLLTAAAGRLLRTDGSGAGHSGPIR